jgi:hypothetical protein
VLKDDGHAGEQTITVGGKDRTINIDAYGAG